MSGTYNDRALFAETGRHRDPLEHVAQQCAALLVELLRAGTDQRAALDYVHSVVSLAAQKFQEGQTSFDSD
jgi:hypothetical protein